MTCWGIESGTLDDSNLIPLCYKGCQSLIHDDSDSHSVSDYEYSLKKAVTEFLGLCPVNNLCSSRLHYLRGNSKNSPSPPAAMALDAETNQIVSGIPLARNSSFTWRGRRRSAEEQRRRRYRAGAVRWLRAGRTSAMSRNILCQLSGEAARPNSLHEEYVPIPL